jgi:hypothetical protein
MAINHHNRVKDEGITDWKLWSTISPDVKEEFCNDNSSIAFRKALAASHPRSASRSDPVGRPKSAKKAKTSTEQQICFDWNKKDGLCKEKTCPHGRLHECKRCGDSEHKEWQCKKKAP